MLYSSAKFDESLKKLWIANQKCDNADYDDAAT